MHTDKERHRTTANPTMATSVVVRGIGVGVAHFGAHYRPPRHRILHATTSMRPPKPSTARRLFLCLVCVCGFTMLNANEFRVVLITIDGLRADVVTQDYMPHVADMLSYSSYSLSAQSLIPPYTIPNHVSIVTGQLPQTHGINAQVDAGNVVVNGSIMEIAHAAGLSTGVYISKDKLRLLNKQGTTDMYFMTNSGTAEQVVSRFERDMDNTSSQWNFTLIHIVDPDAAGHADGWLSPSYFAAITRADGYIDRIKGSIARNGLSDSTTLIILSDHGGIQNNHIDPIPEVMTIPWIALGPGIRQNHEIQQAIATYDTAPTVLQVLSINIPKTVEGAVITEILQHPTAFTRGDANGDSRINITDVIVILGYLFHGLSASCALASDVDDDLSISITDPIYLLNAIFLGGPPPPPPYPQCGATADSSLPCDLQCP